MEARMLRHSTSQIALGQILAFFLGVIGLVGGLFLAWNGKSFAGLTTFIGTMATLVGTYLYGRKSGQSNQTGTPPKP